MQEPVDQARKQSQARKEKYKALLNLGSSISKDAETSDVISTLKQVQHIIRESNAINDSCHIKDRLDSTSEIVMDAQVIKMSHELMNSALHNANSNEFDDKDFLDSVKRIIGPDARNWDELAQMFMPVARTVFQSQSMFGTFVAEPVVKETVQKEKRQRVKTQASQQVKPETIKQLKQEEKRAQMLNVIMNRLQQIFEENNNTPIPYYKLIIDPENFANSIDNQFQVSFLFRDGYLCIADGADSSGPMVSLVTDRHKTSGHFKENKQFVGTLTPLQYMELIELYNIKESMLHINRN